MTVKKSKARFEYGTWDLPEDSSIAFANVKDGRWDLIRFQAWVYQVELEEYRNATATEDM